MAITGSAAMLAGGLIYKKAKNEHIAKEQEKELDRQVAEARKVAAADDPLKRAAEDAQRARTARVAAQRSLAGGARNRSTLLTTPLGGTTERKTLLGT